MSLFKQCRPTYKNYAFACVCMYVRLRARVCMRVCVCRCVCRCVCVCACVLCACICLCTVCRYVLCVMYVCLSIWFLDCAPIGVWRHSLPVIANGQHQLATVHSIPIRNSPPCPSDDHLSSILLLLLLLQSPQNSSSCSSSLGSFRIKEFVDTFFRSEQ